MRLASDARDMSLEDLKARVQAQIASSSHRAYFKKLAMSQSAKYAIDATNEGRWGEKTRWRYDHLVNGFLGAVGPTWTDDTVVFENEDALCMWGYAKSLVAALRE